MLSACCFLLLACGTVYLGCDTGQIRGDDGSLWEIVNDAGFGNDDNFSVVAMHEYGGCLYAMTRNESEGAEVWRYDGTAWLQVEFPGGETNGIYGNEHINNVWGRMAVFNNKLYFGFSSGLQGNYLNSTGCEIWRYDGSSWEPVVSDRRDSEESGTITAIEGCRDDDGETTALITDSSKSWETDQWAGGVLQIASGRGIFRKFDITENTADTLTVQQNDVAGNMGSEFTICQETTYNNPFPKYSYATGDVETGDEYEIGTGWDENGFGEFWNKTITDMELHNGKLYVSTGLNYEYGAQVWYTEDGDTWTVTVPENSFGNYHTDGGTYGGGQKAVSSSITNLAVFDDTLYAGGTGTTGDNGGCARMAKLTDAGWELIVDVDVDENDTGTNENGFGDGMGCDMNNGNFMPWSLATFNSMLHVGVNSLGGARILYSPTASGDDDSDGKPTWQFSAGGDSEIPNGFDGVINGAMDDTYQNIAVNLFTYNGTMYGGLVTTYIPEYGADETYLTGSHIWKTDDGLTWARVTGNGFRDREIIIFEAFAEYNGRLYVSGSKGASSTPTGIDGAVVFRMLEGGA